MVSTARKTLILVLAACAAALMPPVGRAAPTESLDPAAALQPHGLGFAGIYALRQMDPNLTGTGIKFAVLCRSVTYLNAEPQNDYRPNIQHNCFAPSRLSFHDQAPLLAGTSLHSTAICSILLGEDPVAFSPTEDVNLGQFYYQGAAPQAKADVYEFWHFLINNVYPQVSPQADVVTASFGQEFEDWWTTGIEAMVEHQGLIVVAAIGNGSDTYAPVLYPGASANVIGVGVIDSVRSTDAATSLARFSTAYPEHSSFGPAADGRCKPDIVAPGNCLAADANEPNAYKATGNWSSFSTPVAAGAAGLLVQKAKQDPALRAAASREGGNCVIRALLLNSATKLPYWHKGRLERDDDHTAVLDYVQGAGALNAVRAYRQLTAGQDTPGSVRPVGWDNNVLSKADRARQAYRVTVPQPSEKLITVTAVWNRHYQDAYPFEPMPEKDANLRLELWAVDANDPNGDYLVDYSDSSVDNIEHIYTVADANYTSYEIICSFSKSDGESREDLTQQYGLAWSFADEEGAENLFWYDLNADGIVNDDDVAIFINNWLRSRRSPDVYLSGDINADGVIDSADADILLGKVSLTADWYER